LFLLVTSRELLRIQGEVEYPVLPLADLEAVELFCTRARIESDATVADLCRALDNLPLAVELAAARASVFSPAQAYARLSGRLDIFKGGRDADPRQQTLRATIEWSYDLLGSVERRLFACLGVFSGGFTLEAAEQVADAELDVLQALVDKSLLRHTGERFAMLETIREYAVERLDELDAATDLRRRHAAHFAALAERADSELARERQADWLVLLERDYANLRSALAWSLRSEAPELGVRLAGALSQFWSKRGTFPRVASGSLTRSRYPIAARHEPRCSSARHYWRHCRATGQRRSACRSIAISSAFRSASLASRHGRY
jgi:predicted ATPase